MKNRISKILIANRGEIACRIIRSAKKLGIKTVAIYSDVDKDSINVVNSDEAFCVGTSSSLDSYLRQDRILKVASKTKCEAIHPGYGFLSENAEFAELCEQNGFIFIGPPSSAIRDMGIKSTSKKIMADAGVPVIAGYHDEDQSDSTLAKEAENIGYPLMIKAIRGGGGKGMRIVKNRDEFITQLQSARRESLSAFGDQHVLLEKFIMSPRHVEVQIFGDHYGHCVHLFERDCSIQRRHQKVIEEAPAPGLDDTLRKNIGSAAVRAAKAVNYVGAGTVEFIYDQSQSKFYFMEMNTRLQVEHPITEMITNMDLVEWQIKVAAGEKFPFQQEDIKLHGHAVEARIYAEDPYNGFLPTAGPVTYLSSPESANDVRIETGVRQNDEVSVHYDPMIAKLIVWGENRLQAFSKLKTQLLNYNIVGLNTNIEFLTNLSSHPELLAGNVDTGFIETHKQQLLTRKIVSLEVLAQAVLTKVLWENEETQNRSTKLGILNDPWVLETGFRVNHSFTRQLELLCNDQDYTFEITYKGPNTYSIKANGNSESLDVEGYINISINNKQAGSIITHFPQTVQKCTFFVENSEQLHLFTSDGVFCFASKRPLFEGKLINREEVKNVAVSPMPGIIDTIFVKIGDKVTVGDQLMVVIAMKMEHVIKSPKNGVVSNILFSTGDSVPKNSLLVEIDEQKTD